MHTLRHFFGYIVPLLVILIVLLTHTSSDTGWDEILQVSALAGVSMIVITFAVGSLSKFWQPMNLMKPFREYWGLWAVGLITLHVTIAVVDHYNLDLSFMFSRDNPNQLGIYVGSAAFLYIAFMGLISNRYSIEKLGHNWKRLQTLGYLALVLVIIHFMLLNTDDGVFAIDDTLTRVIFASAVAVVLLRLYVWVWVQMTKPKLPPVGPEDSLGKHKK